MTVYGGLRLTTLEVKNAKPTEKKYSLSDENGLQLTIKIDGKKIWEIRYTINGKSNTTTIGTFPSVSLKEARLKRDDFKLLTTDEKLNDISATEIDHLLEFPMEYYLIDIDSPTVITDIVIKIQRMSLSEFTSEVNILNLITNYETNYNLTLCDFIQVLNPLIKKYYNLLLEERERLIN